MDRREISHLAHRDHPLAAPVSVEHARRLLEFTSPPTGGRVVDLGCGSGEWLFELLARRPDLTATGVDASLPDDIEARTRRLGLADRATWVQADALSWDGGPHDLMLYVGVSHVFGGPSQTLRHARQFLRPGGEVLLGDMIWEGVPSVAAQRALEAVAGDFPDLAGLVDLARQNGFEPGHGHVSSRAEWDDYEWSWTGALVRWALAPGRDPEQRDSVLAVARGHRDSWLRGYRHELGFACLVLHDLSVAGST